MTTPKPTPREALSHLCWALTHGEDADEDIRVLSAALEQLEWLRKQAEVFQDCNTGLARERDALRAENAALDKRCDHLEHDRRRVEDKMSKYKNERDALRAENAALKAELDAIKLHEAINKAERERIDNFD